MSNHLEEFLVWLTEEGKDSKTIVAYRIAITQFITWYEGSGGTDITLVKPIDVKEYVSYMKHVLNRFQATVNKSVAALKTFYNYLSDIGAVIDNPMTRIKLQKIRHTEGTKNNARWLTRQEQERFISYVNLEKNDTKRLRNLAIIDLMLYCGLRVNEVSDLKLDDIKVGTNIRLVVRAGKQGKYSVVTLLNKHGRNLKQWLRQRRNHKYSTSPYLFVSERAEWFSPRGIQLMLEKYAKLANMEGVTPHRFRHSFCKNLAQAGVGIEIIRRLARHESIQTSAIYIDPSYNEQMEALARI
ncbi:MAG: tyrosine-type recombinase/integrase [Firmicutes bacterium]|nr:tyrosine-type recombinase/integrase [Bacillota bacterium]